MLVVSRRAVAALALLGGLAVMLSVVTSIATATDDQELVRSLRAGELVIVVRHGATFSDQADKDPLNFDNIAAQRNLDDKGKALATAFGRAFSQIGIPIGKVYTSRFNWAYETAVLAGFKDIEKTTDLTEGGLVVSPNENNRRAEAFRKISAWRRRPARTRSLSPISPTSSTHSVRTGSM